MWEICCKRLAPMRLVPFSYFCTCWKVRPSASPSFSWLIASIIRRMRTRLPTCLSMGLGAFLAAAITISYAAVVLANVPVAGPERNRIPSKTRRLPKKIVKTRNRPTIYTRLLIRKGNSPIVSIVTNARKVVVPRPVHNLALNKGYADFRASGGRRPPARAEDPQKGNGDYHSDEAVTPAGVESARGGLRERRIEHALGPERQRFDDTPERIDDCGNSAIGGPHQRKPLFDRAYSRLLEVLVGACAGAEPTVV